VVYNELLATKIRALVARRRGWTEKKMFGGVAFMLNGKMCCGVIKNDLLVRVGPEQNKKALALPNSRPMDFTGKPMKGFIYVDSKGWSKEASLKKWIEMGIDYASKLPKK
jgi:TfoX/Sxy family transcriptional regulator of competence genes